MKHPLASKECALALNHVSVGTLAGLCPLDVLEDVLNSIRHVAQVIMKYHAYISVLKSWVKYLNSGETKTPPPNPQEKTVKEDCVL